MKSIDQLKETLIKENQLYAQILKLAEKKTKVVADGDIKTLENITKQEQQYIVTMATFEKIRKSIFANIAEELNIREPESLSELILHLEEDLAKEIDDLRHKLLRTIDELKAVNKSNEKLIHQSLEYIQFNLSLLTDSQDGNRYSSTATENKETKPIHFFDMKV